MREMLKSPFRKLKNFALSKQGSSEESPPRIDEGLRTDVAKLTQEAEGMQEKFEGFLTNGHVISGAAYDFSRSLQDMASYMMESFGEAVDGEIGNLFNLLAKVQFEISKLLDLFAAHVSETIIKPTEDMITRLQEAVIMKNQYDEKWKGYITTQLEKQKRKRGKGNQANQQSVLANEGLREQANAFNVSLQSLMQQQLESLVTQAVKYHSAQMHLFSKALASMSAMEPMMKQLASEKSIDRGFSEEDLSSISYLRTKMDGEGEVATFGYETDSMASSPSRCRVEQTEPSRFSSDSSEEFPPGGRTSVISKSEPISPLMHHRREGTAKASSVDSEHERVRMYALPSPVATGGGKWVENSTHTRDAQKYSGAHFSPAYYSGSILEAHNRSRTEGFNNAIRDILLSRQAEDQQHQSYKLKGTSKKPDFFVEDAKDDNSPSTEKTKRYTQSGPLRDSGWASNKSHCAYLAYSSTNKNLSPLYKSGPISGSPVCSYTACDTPFPPSSVPQISELHKLPPPPLGTLTPPKSPSHTPTTHSAQLGNAVLLAPNQAGSTSPLPSPPVSAMSRSLSIPASTSRGSDMTDS